MLTNKEFIRMHRGADLTEEQGRECLARLSSVLDCAAGVTRPDALKSLSAQNQKETAEYIAEELADSFANECRAIADAIDGTWIDGYLIENNAPRGDEFTAADLVEFARYVLEKYAAQDAAAAVKDSVKYEGLTTFKEFCQDVESDFEELQASLSDDLDGFDPVGTAAQTGAPVLFS